jgi:hypothetical protein
LSRFYFFIRSPYKLWVGFQCSSSTIADTFSRDCFCGSSINTCVATVSSDSPSGPCTGNSLENCGSSNLWIVYPLRNNTTDPVTGPPVQPQGDDIYMFSNYWTDSPFGSLIPSPGISTVMTVASVELCLAYCEANLDSGIPWTYAAVEGGE